MSIYEVLKRVISRGGYNVEDMRSKLDLFMLYDRLTVEQYDELATLLQEVK